MIGRLLLIATLATGCVGFSYRGLAGVSHGGGATRMVVDGSAGIDTRTYTSASDTDRAILGYLGVGPRVSRRLDNGRLAGGFAVTLGAAYFRGRYGAVGLASVGGLFGESRLLDNDPYAARERLVIRFQAGLEVEAGRSDWRIEPRPEPCGGSAASFVPNKRSHYLIGLLPGVEYYSGRDGGFAVSLSASFRNVREPPC
jgi:hypothetical protein